MTVERVYALTKVDAGDWLLPSNDARTIWRIARYVDGPTYGVDREDIPTDREFWGVWRWIGSTASATQIHGVDTVDWTGWSMDAQGLTTRQEAIDEALRLDPANY